MGKAMSDVSRGMSITKDQACFLLAGGYLKMSSYPSPAKCSVSSIPLESVATMAGEDNMNHTQVLPDAQINSNTFQWTNILKKYKNRCVDLENVNLYTYCADFWKQGKKIIPQFFGYFNRPSWPLEESYSKWTLTLYKPWHVSIDELKQGHETFAEALINFMQDPLFPPKTRTEITRLQRNEGEVDASEGADIVGDNNHSPTAYDCMDIVNNNAEAMAIIAQDAARLDGVNTDDLHEINMEDELYNSLRNDAPPGHSWSAHYDESLSSKLEEYTKAYYQKQRALLLNQENEPLLLFDIVTHCPENVKSPAQKFLVYHHLYYQYQHFLFNTGQLPSRPPSQCIYVEGLPGVGKTFVINTIRNITRIIYNSNRADLASAPTGCAAALIDGSTHCWAAAIPTGKRLYKAPTNIAISNAETIIVL